MNPVSSKKLSTLNTLKVLKSSDLDFENVLPPDLATSKSLVFISKPEMLTEAKSRDVHGFIILDKIAPGLEKDFPAESSIWTMSDLYAAMTEVLPLFDRITVDATASIHPTASISPQAKIGKNVSIGAYAVIDEQAHIEDHVKIGPHVVIEHHAVIKERAVIQAHTFIGAYCEIGQHCRLSPHVVIGADGFGYYTDKTFTHHKTAQIGKVVLEDHVELGAFCAVDRATLTETRIGAGTKLDNFCHIGHNCIIGKNAIAAAAFKTAGSTKIGNNLMSSGSVDLNGHISITDNVILSARAGVTNSIDKPGVYGGFPAMNHKDNLKVMTSLPHLPKMRKQIVQILKHLGLTEKE